jgi:hypothetical protein
MEAPIMNTPKPVTPAEAKIVWATLRNPSARRVAEAFCRGEDCRDGLASEEVANEISAATDKK